MDPQQNRSIANPNCEKIRLGVMNLTVSNGSNGDGHANIMKKHILKVNPNYVFALSWDLESKK